jgi:hypothetical protein
MAEAQQNGQSSGPSVDRQGSPVIDPTENVLALVAAQTKRSDDLMAANKELTKEVTKRQDDLRELQFKYTTDIAGLRAEHARELSNKESERLDSIRAVDVGAVSRASEVQTTAAATLAAQVATTADTMRTQVAAAASATATALNTALEPILTRIAELSRIQYEQQGQKTQQQETRVDQRGNTQNNQWLIGIAIGVAIFVADFLVKRV